MSDDPPKELVEFIDVVLSSRAPSDLYRRYEGMTDDKHPLKLMIKKIRVVYGPPITTRLVDVFCRLTVDGWDAIQAVASITCDSDVQTTVIAITEVLRKEWGRL